jgi:inosine-uridine nucleoside N-ribohydrolase
MLTAVSPEVEMLGVVVTGTDGERRARAVAKALSVVGRDDVGVYLGAPPLSPQPDFPYMSQFPRRLYGLRPQIEKWAQDFKYEAPGTNGVDFYLQQVAQSPGQISVIVTGPLSTLGRAMQVADTRGTGAPFRRAIRQVLFSGGDFNTAEYNVYSDVGAARLVFHSGVTIYQFGGEGKGKAYLTYDYRQRLWQAQTPATWALQDLYRLWQAGWDPTSPFVPILYDAHPVAYLIDGESISRFQPMQVDLDPVGHLVRRPGGPKVYVRVANSGDRLVEFVIDRLTSGIQPAANHLRAVRRMAEGSGAAELSGALDVLLARLHNNQRSDAAAVRGLLDEIEPKLAVLTTEASRAQRHLRMARAFILGEPRSHPWTDPYTPRFITLSMPFYKVAGIWRKTLEILADHRAAGGALMVLVILALGVVTRGIMRSRRFQKMPGS